MAACGESGSRPTAASRASSFLKPLTGDLPTSLATTSAGRSPPAEVSRDPASSVAVTDAVRSAVTAPSPLAALSRATPSTRVPSSHSPAGSIASDDVRRTEPGRRAGSLTSGLVTRVGAADGAGSGGRTREVVQRSRVGLDHLAGLVVGDVGHDLFEHLPGVR